jgi:hypothetical protein
MSHHKHRGAWKCGKAFPPQPWPLSAGHSLPELRFVADKFIGAWHEAGFRIGEND